MPKPHNNKYFFILALFSALTACTSAPTVAPPEQPQVVTPSPEQIRINELERQLADKQRQCADEKRRQDQQLKESQKKVEELQRKIEALRAIDRELRRSRGN